MAKGIRSVWVDSDTPEAIGNKVFKDGVEIADIPNGVQEYKDPDVVVNREYKYVIQSYTATGQSTDEVLGDNLNYYTIVEATGLKPIMTNFRVLAANKNRILFDTPLGPITGLTTQGFTVSGNNVSAIDTANNFITVGTNFDSWDNNTIRLESGDGTVYDFTMEAISNDVDDPVSTRTRFVSVNGSGAHDGSSQTDEWTFDEARTGYQQGDTVYLRKGSYSGSYTFTTVASKTNPVKFIGYDTDPGDLDDVYIVDSFTYTSPAQAEAQIDPTVWPVFTGDETTDCFYSNGRSGFIFKNIQVQKYKRGFWWTGTASGVKFENCTSALNYMPGTGGDGQGWLFGLVTTLSNIRVTKCLGFDNGGFSYRFNGSHHAIIDSLAYSGKDGDISTDYYVSLYTCMNCIVRNNTAVRPILTQHDGHAFGIKADGGTTEYNLFADNRSENIAETYYVGYSGAAHNVFKRNTYFETINFNTGSFLLVRQGAHDNIFENNYADSLKQCIIIWTGNVDDPSMDAGRANIFRNNIFKNYISGVVFGYGNVNGQYSIDDNEISNNTFYDGDALLYNSTTPAQMTFSGNTFTNNIVEDCTASTDTYSVLAYNYNDFFNCGFTTPSGTDNIDIDPVFNNTNQGGFQPTATFDTIDAPIIPSILIDIYGDERGLNGNTARGAVKHTNEV